MTPRRENVIFFFTFVTSSQCLYIFLGHDAKNLQSRSDLHHFQRTDKPEIMSKNVKIYDILRRWEYKFKYA